MGLSKYKSKDSILYFEAGKTPKLLALSGSDIKNSILLITVNENPIIESVELNGIKNNKLN